MSNLFLIKEAVASVALSHPEGHDCDTCKAAAGDNAALRRILIAVFFNEQREVRKDG
jgi:hypothetical protein